MGGDVDLAEFCHQSVEFGPGFCFLENGSLQKGNRDQPQALCEQHVVVDDDCELAAEIVLYELGVGFVLLILLEQSLHDADTAYEF